jgi:hypothetical protein
MHTCTQSIEHLLNPPLPQRKELHHRRLAMVHPRPLPLSGVEHAPDQRLGRVPQRDPGGGDEPPARQFLE